MSVPVYAVFKFRGETISDITYEVPKIEGRQNLGPATHCRYEKAGGICHYFFKAIAEKIIFNSKSLSLSETPFEVQINVRSHEGIETPRIDCLFAKNIYLTECSPLSLSNLEKLDYGISVLPNEEENLRKNIGIDYTKSNLFHSNDFKKMLTSKSINEKLHNYFMLAKNEAADVYVWGNLFFCEDMNLELQDDIYRRLENSLPQGIHDVHLNNNDVDFSDGGIFMKFQDRWSGIFMKFEN